MSYSGVASCGVAVSLPASKGVVGNGCVLCASGSKALDSVPAEPL